MKDIIVYENGELELKVSLNSETIWLSTNDMASLFSVKRPAIVKHIKNIYNSFELKESSSCSILEQVAKDGKLRKINYYNLDIIISVGYRVNSLQATKFRQWATRVLKSYISDGYVINSEKITQKRLLHLENDMKDIKLHIKNNTLELNQGIFYNGQIYDAYIFLNDILKSANISIILIDNYINDTVLTIFSKYPKLKFKIITSNISKQLKLDIDKYNSQYNNLEISINKTYHDRFIIIDDNELYHLGASLKDLGKKVFAFNKMDIKMISLN